MAWVAVDLGFLSGGTYSLALATTPDDDALVIVGQGDTGSSSFESHGFWWTEATGMVDLGLLAGGTFSIATGVSNDGTKVCGQADDSSGFPQPVLWTMDLDGTVLSMTALPLLGTGDQGVAFGVSYDGSTVVGFSDTAPYPTPNVNPFSYTSGPSSVDLGLLAGNLVGIGTCCTADGTTVYGGTSNTTDAPWKWTSSVVTAIPLFAGEVAGAVLACAAIAGAAAGFSTTIPGGDQHGFLWTSGGGTSLIGAFAGADFSVAYGMSTLGSFVVGDSATAGNHRAFLWDVANAAGDFEELLPLDGGTDAVARGIAGVDIDNDIVIVGVCRVSGIQHAIYWHQEEPPPPPDPTPAVALPESLGRWRGNVGLNWNGLALVGDGFTNVVGLSNFNIFTEYGNRMRMLVTTPPVHENRKRIFIPRFEIEMEVGEGTPGAPSVAPQIILDYSKNGGKTWVALQMFRSLGAVGEYQTRLQWNNLGESRTWIFRLRYSDTARPAIIGTYLSAYKGLG